MPDDDDATVPRRRPNRWDRPKEPHDWRWVLGHVGRTLVTTGVLMFAFVAYQLWGTGIQTAREQHRLRDEFNELLESTVPQTTVPQTTVPSDSTVEPTTSTDPASTSTTDTGSTTPSLPPDEVPPAVISVPAKDGPLALLNIPKMGVSNKVIVQGVTPSDLQDGPGHFPETPLPGQLGNSAVAGHRTSHGQPFHDIDQLEVGDEITVTTLAGTYIYLVTGSKVVDPNDYDIIPTVDPTKATLTLTSCHPAHSTKHRIVVFSELDVARSSPVTQPTITPSALPDSALPGDDTTPETVTESTTGESTTGESTTSEPATTEQPADQAGTLPPDLSPTDQAASVLGQAARQPPADSVETFGNEWFTDPDAWPQVVLWGLALIAIALGSYAVSRHARRIWVGALVGILPFIVVLYFWFENVNRLLPPNL